MSARRHPVSYLTSWVMCLMKMMHPGHVQSPNFSIRDCITVFLTRASNSSTENCLVPCTLPDWRSSFPSLPVHNRSRCLPARKNGGGMLLGQVVGFISDRLEKERLLFLPSFVSVSGYVETIWIAP
ncbi:hypothetical protein CEXT_33651 [Caerostris extrusa]|uniref:Uncharacterized protein n=1 Tax=Caerostris extrusa TaxID=172846 RepID=A0AAV4PPW2_CAEEX|nr:hypothetical protein CEXT_33651 [Caerostris extrusa]